MNTTSKILILTGVILFFAGVIWHFLDGKFMLGRLPGDFYYESKNFTVFIPFTSGILISLLVSLVVYVLKKTN